MTTVSEVGKAFWEGRRLSGGGGAAANVTSTGNALYEYGWAILAERLPDGKVKIYEGWRHYSRTTAKHFGQLGLNQEGENIIHVDEKKQL